MKYDSYLLPCILYIGPYKPNKITHKYIKDVAAKSVLLIQRI